MYAIFKKEFRSFFSSPIGYAIIAIYLIVNGLFLWFFENNFNILRAGFADLNAYFFIAPWIFLFLIPAITMKSFSEEMTTGTIEILKTKPLSDLQIVLGKFFGSLVLSVFAILPTLTYIYSVYQLGSPVGNIDLGITIGSFVGLLFLTATYTSIGIFSSVLSKNQVFSFLISLSLSFIFFYGFEAVSTYGLVGDLDYFIKNLGLYEHFKGIEKGILDTRSLLYFGAITVFFIAITVFYLQKSSKIVRKSMITIAVLGVVLLVSNSFYKRFDLTQNKRYTLSNTSKDILKNINKNVFVTVFLKGDFPAEFKRLQTETEQFLEELKAENKYINYKFVSSKGQEKKLIEQGLLPSRLQVMEDGDFSEIMIFPWAVVQYQNKVELVSLLKEGTSSENEQLEKSIQNLEYAFANAMHKVSSKKSKKIAIIKGNKELDDFYLVDFLKTIKSYYRIAPFTLDSVAQHPQKTLKSLLKYDAIIVAKPQEKFTEEEKYTLDQYICNGGKSLWLIDQIKVASDTLYTKGETLAYPMDLGLTDLLFSYGVRVNHHLITDKNSAKIPLASGNIGGNTQYQFFNWKYLPLLISEENHLINTNVAPLFIRYGNSIDTLKNKVLKKTVLLKSSLLSKPVGTPKIISLEEIKNTTSNAIGKKEYFMGVLLEGVFTSAYQGRVPPFKNTIKLKGEETKMVIISDGDFVANPIKNGEPAPLDIDKWSGRYYGNKEFLVNAMNYLLNDEGLVKIRSKKIKIPFLDKQKAYQEASYWQFINIVLPLLILGVFGVIYTFIRKRKYAKR